MTWLPDGAPGTTPLDHTFGLRPDAYARFRELYGGLWDPKVIDPRVLELLPPSHRDDPSLRRGTRDPVR